MSTPVLNVEVEFDLMANYQTIIENKSVIIENSDKDEFKYSLFKVKKPYPTYEEYLNGNEFEEGKLIKHSSSIDELQSLQRL
jgi:hypothetical protein